VSGNPGRDVIPGATNGLPESRSHRLTALSYNGADAIVLPSDENATALTSFSSPLRICNSVLELISHRLTCSPDGKTLALALNNKTVKQYDSSTNVASRMLTGYERRVMVMAFSPNDNTLTLALDDEKAIASTRFP